MAMRVLLALPVLLGAESLQVADSVGDLALPTELALLLEGFGSELTKLGVPEFVSELDRISDEVDDLFVKVVELDDEARLEELKSEKKNADDERKEQRSDVEDAHLEVKSLQARVSEADAIVVKLDQKTRAGKTEIVQIQGTVASMKKFRKQKLLGTVSDRQLKCYDHRFLVPAQRFLVDKMLNHLKVRANQNEARQLRVEEKLEANKAMQAKTVLLEDLFELQHAANKINVDIAVLKQDIVEENRVSSRVKREGSLRKRGEVLNKAEKEANERFFDLKKKEERLEGRQEQLEKEEDLIDARRDALEEEWDKLQSSGSAADFCD